MAIYHFHLQTISRGKRRSAVAAAAYRSASKLVDTRQPRTRRGRAARDREERTNRIHDYRAKMGVIKNLILLPPGAPWEYMDRSTLWNMAEAAERQVRAVVAREIDMALPWELSLEEQSACAREFGEWLVGRYGVAVDIAHHLPSTKDGHDQRNYHAHIMFTSREVDEEGFGKKTRILDTRPSGPREVEAMRQAWQDIVNLRLEKNGLDVRIDCRTLDEQGIERIPQIHVGVKSTTMEEDGTKPQSVTRADFQGRKVDWEDIDAARSRAEFNAEIIELNKHRDKFGPLPLEVQIRNIERNIEILLEKITDLEAIIPRGLLPAWARAKLERAWINARQMIELMVLEKHEAEARRVRREREDNSIHARMKRMREEIERLEKDRERRQALQRLYTRIEHIVTTRPPTAQVNHIHTYVAPPPRVLSIEQYNDELTIKADIARAAVPPEYRPRIEIKDVVWEQPEKSPDTGLVAQFEIAKPADNGGLAAPPNPITIPFNAMADPQSDSTYKQKVKISFGMQIL